MSEFGRSRVNINATLVHLEQAVRYPFREGSGNRPREVCPHLEPKTIRVAALRVWNFNDNDLSTSLHGSLSFLYLTQGPSRITLTCL
jgi:hypothetical protein